MEELPEAINSIRAALGIKEGQAKKLIHELVLLIEAQSALNKGEGKELLEAIPEEVRPFVKKAMARVSKSGVFEEKDSLKIFDWKVEKEITNSTGHTSGTNFMVMDITSLTPETIDHTSFHVD